MAWSDYIYLAPLALCAAALFALVVRTAPRLCAPSRTMTRDEALVLSLVTALGLAVIYGRFYLGETLFAYSDVGSDTLEQYVPYYLNMLDSVRDGSLGAWNFEYGLGTSFMSYQSWTLDPFNLVLVPLGLLLGDAHLAIALVVVQSLKIVACAFVADRLLSFYCETPLARLVGASLLSFGGYLVLWGQHYWIGSIYVMALVVLLLLELLREKWTVPRFAGLALGTAVSIVMSTYSGFMIMLFAAIYAALRTLHFAAGRGVAGFARMYGALALPVVCGILMAMVTLVPYAMLMLGDSSRVTGGGESALSRAVEYATSFAPASWVPVVLSRLLGSSLISSGEPIPDAVMAPTEQFPYVNVYEIITLGGCFHGRTFGALAATGRESLSDGFTPLPEGFKQVPANDLAALEAAITPATAAVLVEVVQGEGGIVPLPGDYLRGVEALCRKHDILFICDEVQAGLCRTGTFWAFQQHGLTPDAISMAKSLANGLPMGAMLATDEMAKGFEAGSHATTFGGGALASGVAAKCVEIMLRDKLADRAAELGKHVMDRVRAIQDKLPGTVREVRGLGLMIGIELAVDAAAVWRELIARGFICNLSHGVTLRLLPALTIDKADLDAFIDTLEDILRTAK